MKYVSRKVIAFGLVAAVATLAVATAGTASKHAAIQACALMPDTKSATRWEQFDTPYLQKTFKAAGVAARIVNGDDPVQQKSRAQQCMADGAKVLIIAAIGAISDNPIIVLLMINLILLVLGTFMDMAPLIIITTPIFLPVVTRLGIDPVHFGVIIILNLAADLLYRVLDPRARAA